MNSFEVKSGTKESTLIGPVLVERGTANYYLQTIPQASTASLPWQSTSVLGGLIFIRGPSNCNKHGDFCAR